MQLSTPPYNNPMNKLKYTTLAEFCEYQAQNDPQQVISQFTDEINVFTTQELNEKANLLAKGFLYQGVSKGTPVALVMAKTTNCFTFALALAKIGAILIPIKKNLETKQIEKILKEEKVQTIGFYADSFLNTFRKLVSNIDINERGYFSSKAYPNLKNIVTLGSIKNRGMFTSRELMLVGSHIDDLEVEDALLSVEPSDVYLRKISYGDKYKKSIKSYTHRQIIGDNFSFAEFQKFLIDSIQ